MKEKGHGTYDVIKGCPEYQHFPLVRWQDNGVVNVTSNHPGVRWSEATKPHDNIECPEVLILD